MCVVKPPLVNFMLLTYGNVGVNYTLGVSEDKWLSNGHVYMSKQR